MPDITLNLQLKLSQMRYGAPTQKVINELLDRLAEMDLSVEVDTPELEEAYMVTVTRMELVTE